MLKEDYPVRRACELLDYPRSSYYYPSKDGKENQSLMQAIRTTAGEWPTYGYRRITEQLNRQGWGVNHKRVYYLMRQMDLQRPQKTQKKRTTNSQHPFPRYPNLLKDMLITFPDQAWAADITYIRLGRGFVYLAVLMDLFTRAIRGWNLSHSLDQRLTLAALQRALQNHTPHIHHSDQGLQYAAIEYVDLLKKAGVKISMAKTGEPTQNGFAERLIRTIKEEEVYLSDYEDFHDAYRRIGHFIEDVYQTKRIHSALGYLTPAEFEAAYWERSMDTP